MTDFSTIDPNFRVEPAPDADGLVYRLTRLFPCWV